ncbi:MAG: hypothetical protein ACK4MH_13100 [Brevundimonas sp.]|uniref:hypothetical protein n=1 Tax=Brevundimonas sp. TaxID=1871086 RepID=UPI00391C5A8A
MFDKICSAVVIAACAIVAACSSSPVAVDLSPSQDGVRLDYRAPDAETAVRLSAEIGAASGLETVHDPSDARRFSVEVGRDARRSMYPLAASVGGGRWFIYAPGLLPQCFGRNEVRIGLAGGAASSASCEPDAYLIAHLKNQTPPGAVLSPEREGVGGAIEIAAVQSLELLSERLGPAPGSSHVIGVSVTPDAPSGIVAHVDREGAVLFEVRPSFEAGLNADVLRTQVRPLLRHELFHRWNMTRVAADDGVPTWFYEGAAEYTGGLISLEVGDFSAVEYEWVLGAMLNRCRVATGAAGLEAAGQGRVYDYDCGAVASWLLDLDLRRQGADHYAFWRALVSRAARSGTGRYGRDDIDAVLEQMGWDAPTWRLFLKGGSPERLVEAVGAAGGAIVHEGAAGDYRIALLHPLLAANCESASYGFFDEPAGVTLDVDTVCEVLPSRARISRVAGVDVAADARGAYLAARRTCDQAKTLTIIANDVPVVLQCAALPEPTASFRILDAGLREGVHDAV